MQLAIRISRMFAGAFLTVSLTVPAWAGCGIFGSGTCGYERLVADGMVAGQSLEIRLLTVNRPVRYNEPWVDVLVRFFADRLQQEMRSLRRFSAVAVIPVDSVATGDLVLEGVFDVIDQGPSFGPNPGEPEGTVSEWTSVRLHGSVKRKRDGQEVFSFSCCDMTKGGALGMMTGVSRGRQQAVHGCAGKIAKAIAKAVVTSDKKPKASMGYITGPSPITSAIWSFASNSGKE